jgi:hypothetical protein
MRGISIAGLCASILFGLAITALPARGANTYLLIEHPDRFTLLNKYQQELSREERALLVPFVPLQILKQDDLLGDGYTHCAQVAINGVTFFLMKDAAGRFLSDGSAGVQHTITGAVPIGDTIAIVQERKIEFRSVSGKSRRLDAGSQLLRVFRTSQGIYCRLEGTPAEYGWIRMEGLRQNADWKKVEMAVNGGVASLAETERRIRAHITEVNTVLARLFRFFNKQSGESRRPPAWRVETTGSSITCVLEGTTKPELYRQSSFYLVNTIENIARSAALRVTSTPGRIVVRVAE